MEILLLKNVDSTKKSEFYFLRMDKNGDSNLKKKKIKFYFLRKEWKRMENLLFKIENSTDILESKTNLPRYSQINCKKVEFADYFFNSRICVSILHTYIIYFSYTERCNFRS